MKNFSMLLAAFLLLSACVKDKPVPSTEQAVQLSAAKKVYVINEGNFGSGNASVSLYDPGTGQAIEDLYRSVNGSAAGDVAQSLTLINGSFYLVVNNSGRIMVCDRQFKRTAQVSGLASPRYIQQVSNQKAYVSDLKANAIQVLDLNSNAITGSIACGGWTEKMQMIYNKVFVTNVRRNYVYVVNTITDKVEDSVFVGINAASLVLDRNDKIWVLASGDSSKKMAPRLSRINPVSHQTEAFWDFVSGSPNNLCLNKGKDTLYFLNTGIYRMAATEGALPASAFIAGAGRNYYGLGLGSADHTIYAADALDYTQRSNVYMFSPQGTQLGVFKAGINTNGFYFE